MTLGRSALQVHHTFKLQAIPLDSLTPGSLNDLSWLLGEVCDVTSYTWLIVRDPVLLVFQDSLTTPPDLFFEPTTKLIH